MPYPNTRCRHRRVVEAHHCATAVEFTFKVLLWFLRRHQEPTWQEVADEWGVSRATAYRYKRMFCDAAQVHALSELYDAGVTNALAVSAVNRERFGLHPWRQTLYPQKTGENVP